MLEAFHQCIVSAHATRFILGNDAAHERLPNLLDLSVLEGDLGFRADSYGPPPIRVKVNSLAGPPAVQVLSLAPTHFQGRRSGSPLPRSPPIEDPSDRRWR